MNVTCTGCPAKYSVPDEKVRGKKVRITCKHCGTNIVVDGTALGASLSVLPKVEPEGAGAGAGLPMVSVAPIVEPSSPVAAKPAPAAAETTWLVGFADDCQEPHTTSQVVELYASAKIDDETLLWKDGMDDWLAPFDIPEVAAAFQQRGVARRAPSFAQPLASDDEPTVVGRSPFDDETVVSSAPEVAKPSPAAVAARKSSPEIQPAPSPFAASPKPAAQPAAAKPIAARRTEKRAGAVDLFGGVADAGSESDVSLDFGAAEEPAHKMTGARNESSVLFSLDALTKPDAKAGQQKKAQDKEQEKRASAVLFGDSAPDSLMNVGGGGLAALAAPDFTKPVAPAPEPVRPSDPVEVPNAAPAKGKSSVVLILAVVGVAAAAGLAFMFLSKKPPADKSADTAAVAAKAAATSAPSAAEPAPSTATETAGAAEAASANAPTGSAAAPGASAKPGAAATPATSAAAATPGAVNRPAEKPADSKKPDSAPAAAPVADFDKSAAIAALGAAAGNAASCKKPDGPTGAGKASVTFAPSGRATNSTVTGAFAGTDVGGCVARIFRSARVPPFAGDPVTVSKSFSIE